MDYSQCFLHLDKVVRDNCGHPIGPFLEEGVSCLATSFLWLTSLAYIFSYTEKSIEGEWELATFVMKDHFVQRRNLGRPRQGY